MPTRNYSFQSSLCGDGAELVSLRDLGVREEGNNVFDEEFNADLDIKDWNRWMCRERDLDMAQQMEQSFLSSSSNHAALVVLERSSSIASTVSWLADSNSPIDGTMNGNVINSGNVTVSSSSSEKNNANATVFGSSYLNCDGFSFEDALLDFDDGTQQSQTQSQKQSHQQQPISYFMSFDETTKENLAPTNKDINNGNRKYRGFSSLTEAKERCLTDIAMPYHILSARQQNARNQLQLQSQLQHQLQAQSQTHTQGQNQGQGQRNGNTHKRKTNSISTVFTIKDPSSPKNQKDQDGDAEDPSYCCHSPSLSTSPFPSPPPTTYAGRKSSANANTNSGANGNRTRAVKKQRKSSTNSSTSTNNSKITAGSGNTASAKKTGPKGQGRALTKGLKVTEEQLCQSRKTGHNMIEKRYRTNLNERIECLRICVPVPRGSSSQLSFGSLGRTPGLSTSTSTSSGSRINGDGENSENQEQREQGEDGNADVLGDIEEGEEGEGSSKIARQKYGKAAILTRALEYIKHLEGTIERMGGEIEGLRQRVGAFEKLALGERWGSVGGEVDTTERDNGDERERERLGLGLLASGMLVGIAGVNGGEGRKSGVETLESVRAGFKQFHRRFCERECACY